MDIDELSITTPAAEEGGVAEKWNPDWKQTDSQSEENNILITIEDSSDEESVVDVTSDEESVVDVTSDEESVVEVTSDEYLSEGEGYTADTEDGDEFCLFKNCDIVIVPRSIFRRGFSKNYHDEDLELVEKALGVIVHPGYTVSTQQLIGTADGFTNLILNVLELPASAAEESEYKDRKMKAVFKLGHDDVWTFAPTTMLQRADYEDLPAFCCLRVETKLEAFDSQVDCSSCSSILEYPMHLID